MEQSQTIYSITLCQGPTRVVGNPLGDLNSAPRCGAKTCRGSACQSPAMPNGRCRMYGRASTGPRSAEGLARMNKWYVGGGASWSQLTTNYSKQSWHPRVGGGRDWIREDFSLRGQVEYVLPGSDHQNAVQGPEFRCGFLRQRRTTTSSGTRQWACMNFTRQCLIPRIWR